MRVGFSQIPRWRLLLAIDDGSRDHPVALFCANVDVERSHQRLTGTGHDVLVWSDTLLVTHVDRTAALAGPSVVTA